ncbi:MAG: hypothetical protein HYS24_13010 [Ignavibacteriales bacterium]|nr:hypothetical protein [Ignavibacteriales bacterium]
MESNQVNELETKLNKSIETFDCELKKVIAEFPAQKLPADLTIEKRKRLSSIQREFSSAINKLSVDIRRKKKEIEKSIVKIKFPTDCEIPHLSEIKWQKYFRDKSDRALRVALIYVDFMKAFESGDYEFCYSILVGIEKKGITELNPALYNVMIPVNEELGITKLEEEIAELKKLEEINSYYITHLSSTNFEYNNFEYNNFVIMN